MTGPGPLEAGRRRLDAGVRPLDARPLDARPGARARAADLAAPAALLGVGLLAFVLARAALLPDVGLWDTAEYQTVPPLLGTLHPTGYPAYVILGWVASVVLAPLGSAAFRMDLLSAVLLGAAVAGTAWLTLALTGRLPIAAAAAVGLAVTPIAWRIGTRADAHALHLALLPYLLLALVVWERRRRAGDPSADRLLVVAAAILGVALADHRLILFLVPGIVAYVLVVDPRLLRRRRLVGACLAAALGTAAILYLELPLRAGPFPAPIVYGHPDTFAGFWYVVLGSQFVGALQAPLADPGRELAQLGSLVVDQLGVLAVALPAAILVAAAHRPRYALLTLPAALVTCFFAAGYSDADIGRYYLGPALMAWTWLAIAAAWLLDLLAVERGWGWPSTDPQDIDLGSEAGSPAANADPGAAGGAPAGPATAGAVEPVVAAAARRRRGRIAMALVAAALVAPLLPLVPARWTAVSASSEAALGRPWLDAALATMDRDAVVVSWWSYSTPLWYAQLIEGRRLDLRVVDDRTILDQGLGDIYAVIDSNLGRRPVYAIRVDPVELARLAHRYDLTTLRVAGGPPLIRIDRLRDASA